MDISHGLVLSWLHTCGESYRWWRAAIFSDDLRDCIHLAGAFVARIVYEVNSRDLLRQVFVDGLLRHPTTSVLWIDFLRHPTITISWFALPPN